MDREGKSWEIFKAGGAAVTNRAFVSFNDFFQKNLTSKVKILLLYLYHEVSFLFFPISKTNLNGNK
jgi:hypothetical protein